jgi:hypothetical protein
LTISLKQDQTHWNAGTMIVFPHNITMNPTAASAAAGYRER